MWRVVKYCALAGVLFALFLGLLLMALGYTEQELARDGYNLPPLWMQLLMLLMSLSPSAR
jgi:hypothetical protein